MLAELIAALPSTYVDMTAAEIADKLWQMLQLNVSAKEWGHIAEHNTRSYNEQTVQEASDLSRITTGTTLPRPQTIEQALRLLVHRLSSHATVVLNKRPAEPNTTEAQTNMWIPILDSLAARWLDIEIVVDAGFSMQFWQQTITELHLSLERPGAFRTVHLSRLATDDPDHIYVYTDTDPSQKQWSKQHRQDQDNSAEDQLILVISDYVSPAWHSGKVQNLLHLWGQKNLVTLIDVLPRRLWPRTALGMADRVEIYSSQPTTTNAQLTIDQPALWFDDDQPDEQTVPFPVITLEAKLLVAWADVITNTQNIWIAGITFVKEPYSTQTAPPMPKTKEDHSPQKRIRIFRTSASSLAQKFAGLLAAVPIPLNLPIIELIRYIILPEAGQLHTAEVFLGGLLEEIYRDEVQEDPNLILYDFIAGVRDELLKAVPIPDAYRVRREISAFLQDRSD